MLDNFSKIEKFLHMIESQTRKKPYQHLASIHPLDRHWLDPSRQTTSVCICVCVGMYWRSLQADLWQSCTTHPNISFGGVTIDQCPLDSIAVPLFTNICIHLPISCEYPDAGRIPRFVQEFQEGLLSWSSDLLLIAWATNHDTKP